MKITRANLTRIMKIEDPSKRKSKLQDLCLSIGWHGGVWREAMDELDRLNKAEVKTALEVALANKSPGHRLQQ